MSTVTLPRSDIPMIDGVIPSREMYRWMRDITERVGGVTGSGSADFAASAFEDAGIEETKWAVANLSDSTGQDPVQTIKADDLLTELHSMQAQIDQLRAVVEGLTQGAA